MYSSTFDWHLKYCVTNIELGGKTKQADRTRHEFIYFNNNCDDIFK